MTSTGVIGEYLPMEKIKGGIDTLFPGKTLQAAEDFNQAILTTDTMNKRVCYQTTIDGATVSIGGVAKGSGMINPNMATMLSFVTTDAAIEQNTCSRRCLRLRIKPLTVLRWMEIPQRMIWSL